MARWKEIERAQPDFARRVRERFDSQLHKVMATIRKDGSPRISGIEAEFVKGDIRLGMMPGSLKVADLRRDPRISLHSGTEAPPSQEAGEVVDAKLSGAAIEATGRKHPSFTIDVREVVLISVGDPPDHLVIESWHQDDGLRSVKRY